MLSHPSTLQCHGLALLLLVWSSTAVPAGMNGKGAAELLQERRYVADYSQPAPSSLTS